LVQIEMYRGAGRNWDTGRSYEHVYFDGY